MSEATMSDKVWELINSLISGIPENTTKLVMTFECNKLVIVDVEYYPDIQKPDTVNQSFELVPINPSGIK